MAAAGGRCDASVEIRNKRNYVMRSPAPSDLRLPRGILILHPTSQQQLPSISGAAGSVERRSRLSQYRAANQILFVLSPVRLVSRHYLRRHPWNRTPTISCAHRDQQLLQQLMTIVSAPPRDSP